MRPVPPDAEEVDSFYTDGAEIVGVWRGADGRLYLAGYHLGPSGDALLIVNPDGTVENPAAITHPE